MAGIPMDVKEVAVYQLMEAEEVRREDIAKVCIEGAKLLHLESAEVVVHIIMNDESYYDVPVQARVHYEAIFWSKEK